MIEVYPCDHWDGWVATHGRHEVEAESPIDAVAKVLAIAAAALPVICRCGKAEVPKGMALCFSCRDEACERLRRKTPEEMDEDRITEANRKSNADKTLRERIRIY